MKNLKKEKAALVTLDGQLYEIRPKFALNTVTINGRVLKKADLVKMLKKML